MQYPLQLTFKVLAVAPQILLADAQGKSVAYIRQKMFKFKEEVGVFSDNSRSDQLFVIKADRIIDFSARYNFTFAENGAPVGSVKRQGMRSLWRSQYEVADEAGENAMTLREENPWAKFFDGLLGELPLIGMLSGYLFHPAYALTDTSGQLLLRLVKKPSFFESRFEVEKHQEMDSLEEWRALLALLMMVLLERDRG